MASKWSFNYNMTLVPIGTHGVCNKGHPQEPSKCTYPTPETSPSQRPDFQVFKVTIITVSTVLMKTECWSQPWVSNSAGPGHIRPCILNRFTPRGQECSSDSITVGYNALENETQPSTLSKLPTPKTEWGRNREPLPFPSKLTRHS